MAGSGDACLALTPRVAGGYSSLGDSLRTYRAGKRSAVGRGKDRVEAEEAGDPWCDAAHPSINHAGVVNQLASIATGLLQLTGRPSRELSDRRTSDQARAASFLSLWRRYPLGYFTSSSRPMRSGSLSAHQLLALR